MGDGFQFSGPNPRFSSAKIPSHPRLEVKWRIGSSPKVVSAQQLVLTILFPDHLLAQETRSYSLSAVSKPFHVEAYSWLQVGASKTAADSNSMIPISQHEDRRLKGYLVCCICSIVQVQSLLSPSVSKQPSLLLDDYFSLLPCDQVGRLGANSNHAKSEHIKKLPSG